MRGYWLELSVWQFVFVVVTHLNFNISYWNWTFCHSFIRYHLLSFFNYKQFQLNFNTDVFFICLSVQTRTLVYIYTDRLYIYSIYLQYIIIWNTLLSLHKNYLKNFSITIVVVVHGSLRFPMSVDLRNL